MPTEKEQLREDMAKKDESCDGGFVSLATEATEK
jgi:hypothetical protein